MTHGNYFGFDVTRNKELSLLLGKNEHEDNEEDLSLTTFLLFTRPANVIYFSIVMRCVILLIFYILFATVKDGYIMDY